MSKYKVYEVWDDLIWWLGGKERCPSIYFITRCVGNGFEWGLFNHAGGGLYGYIHPDLVPRLKKEGYLL